MRTSRIVPAVLLLALTALPVLAAEGSGSEEKKPQFTACEMSFKLQGWSVFYKSAKGEGTITCDNGQTAQATLRVRGGGLTAGKSEVLDGVGRFSDVIDINEVFGSYAQAQAHAGVLKSSEASVLTKGEVSLALAGTGRGIDLGISFGKFTITRK